MHIFLSFARVVKLHFLANGWFMLWPAVHQMVWLSAQSWTVLCDSVGARVCTVQRATSELAAVRVVDCREVASWHYTHSQVVSCFFNSSIMTQPSIPPGSVNEYQLRLRRQRHVWFVPLAMNAGCAGKTVRSLENACHTWAPYRCVHDKALYKSTFTLPYFQDM